MPGGFCLVPSGSHAMPDARGQEAGAGGEQKGKQGVGGCLPWGRESTKQGMTCVEGQMRLPSATSTPRPSRQLWCVPRELKAARGQAHFLKKLLQAPAGTFLYSKRNALAEEHGRSVNSGGAVKGGLAAARSFCSSAGQEASVPTNTLVTGSRAAPLSATSQQLGPEARSGSK